MTNSKRSDKSVNSEHIKIDKEKNKAAVESDSETKNIEDVEALGNVTFKKNRS